jgi:hypothetical protein
LSIFRFSNSRRFLYHLSLLLLENYINLTYVIFNHNNGKDILVHYRIFTLAFIASVTISGIFLAYTGNMYFNTCMLTYGVRISIPTYHIERSNSSITVKNAFLLENPSSLSFKVTYIREEVYDDHNLETELGEIYKSVSSGSYIVLVNAFSNATINLTVPLAESPSTKNLYVKTYLLFVGIPILGSLYPTRYFSLLNVTVVEGIS